MIKIIYKGSCPCGVDIKTEVPAMPEHVEAFPLAVDDEPCPRCKSPMRLEREPVKPVEAGPVLRPGERPLRIGFIGAHSTGKSTVGEMVAERLGLPWITEIAREVAREWGLTPATIPAARLQEYQWEILHRQIEAQEAHVATGACSDRTPLDNKAYWLVLEDVPPNEAAAYDRLVRTNLAFFDVFVLIEPGVFPLVDDGERHADPAFQQTIHNMIEHLVKAHGIEDRVIRINSDGPELRAEEIIAEIGRRFAHV